MYGKEGLKSIINARSKFWHPEDVNRQKAVLYSHTIITFTKKMQLSLLVIMVISLEFHLLKPFFNKGEVFPLNVWIKYDSMMLHILVLIMQDHSLCMALFVMTHDILYLSICVHLMIQLRFLKWKMHEAAVGSREDLKKCIEYQEFLSR